MKEIERKLVCELIKNSRKSDRELAKLIGVSQPTVSRTRARLEKEGLIEYSGVPNLRKMGFEIIAITFGNRAKLEPNPKLRVQKAEDFTAKRPNLIFASTGRGLDSDRVAVSVHKNYSDYNRYIQGIKEEWEGLMTITGSFLIALNSDNVLRPISMKYLAECFGKED
jgi:DNA-binding Lrp family transcriptional regulator